MDWKPGALVLSRYRYRWKDRHDDLVNRRNPWPLRIEAGILAAAMLLAAATAIKGWLD